MKRLLTHFFALAALILPCFFGALDLRAVAPATAMELKIANSAQEEYQLILRDHIVLVWPKNFPARWYPNSPAKSPEELADWLEKCYTLCVGYFGYDPNALHNRGKNGEAMARLLFLHNGMRDYNYGGALPRPVIGLRDLNSPYPGTEDFFGWLTHEMSHEFLVISQLVNIYDNNVWHEALCDYLRYFLLLDSGHTDAAKNWEEAMFRAPRTDRYRGGGAIILRYHQRKGFQSPREMLASLNKQDLRLIFGHAPWQPGTLAFATSRPESEVVITARIDGSGKFVFSGTEVSYVHESYRLPTEVFVNGVPWRNLSKPLALGRSYDYSRAAVVAANGRDTITLVNKHSQGMTIYARDGQPGAAVYKIKVTFR